jgi:hypothetical protein
MVDSVVLLISGSSSRLEVLKNALQKVGWRVAASGNPKEALGALQKQAFEAVFCDQDFKGASIPGFLSFARRLHPNMPFYVFGEVDRSSFKTSGDPNGFLPYPPIEAHLPVPKGSKSIEEKAAGVKTPLSGNTSLVALSTVMETMSMAGQTANIELDFGRQGLIHVNNGMVEHAVVFQDGQSQQGLNALAQLLIKENTEFRLVKYEAPKRLSVNLPVNGALTEAARMADEVGRFQKFINAVRKACPSTQAIAIGYPLNAAPSASFGQVTDLFQKAKTLLDKNREILGNKPNLMLIATDQSTFALTSFGEGNILVSMAPANARENLLKAVKEAIQSELIRG